MMAVGGEAIPRRGGVADRRRRRAGARRRSSGSRRSTGWPATVRTPTLDGAVAPPVPTRALHRERAVVLRPAQLAASTACSHPASGIPITLSVVTIEVGRRVGVPLAGSACPAHFLVGDKVDPDVVRTTRSTAAALLDAGLRRPNWFQQVTRLPARPGATDCDPRAHLPTAIDRSPAVLSNLRAVFGRRTVDLGAPSRMA